MNSTEIKKIRDQLLIMKSDLEELEETSKESSEIVELDQSKVGRVSRIDAIMAQQMALETERRRQNQLLKIESTLQRIKLNEYGYCYICGEGIDPRRLSVDPTNTRCLKCVEEQ